MFLVFEIIVFELAAVNSPHYYQNTRSIVPDMSFILNKQS